MATLAHIRARTFVPIPRTISYGHEDTGLGFEWILMESVPGVPLKTEWGQMGVAPKERARPWMRNTSVGCTTVAASIGSETFSREDFLDRPARMAPTADRKSVMRPIVTIFMFAGGRKLSPEASRTLHFYIQNLWTYCFYRRWRLGHATTLTRM